MNDYEEYLNGQLEEMVTKMAARGIAQEELLRIRDAFAFAKEAHSGQKRKSGEPYIIHPMISRMINNAHIRHACQGFISSIVFLFYLS